MATRKSTTAAVELIFKYWQTIMEKPLAKLTPGRKAKIEARLKTYSVDDLLKAIIGCKSSGFHMGQNDSNTLYNSLELICRNDEKVEFFMEKAGMPTPVPSRNIMDKLTDRAWAEEAPVVASIIEGEVGDMFAP